MNTKYRLLQVDYWIQTILGGAILAGCVAWVGALLGHWNPSFVFYYPLYGSIFFGAAQVLSGLGLAIAYKDRKRMVYLLLVAAFFGLWLVSAEIPYYEYRTFMNVYMIVLCIIPPSLGIYYYVLTVNDFNVQKRRKIENTLNQKQFLGA